MRKRRKASSTSPWRRVSIAPLSQPVIEYFSKGYHYVPSDRYYETELKDGAYIFRCYKCAPDGARIHVFEHKVDWILGSGNHSRVYIYQTQDGARYQLPLAWYSQGEGLWAMAPGFEFKLQLGVGRQVRCSCMSCHNAYPDVAEGSDRLYMPEGIGCHGPGADHVRAAMEGAAEPVSRAEIVNPGNLPRE
ncbi:MAG: hypothetical protein QNJ43_04000 [Breoghania sp.]|nr:hypothetical protein [Breoghania sp.]